MTLGAFLAGVAVGYWLVPKAVTRYIFRREMGTVFGAPNPNRKEE